MKRKLCPSDIAAGGWVSAPEPGRVLLSETITLMDGAELAGHTAQELQEDGSLGGVQLWRSTKKVE